MNPSATHSPEKPMFDITAFGLRTPATPDDAPVPDPVQVATAQAFLQTLPRTEKGGSRWPGSYHLKHLAERWGAENGRASYVSNGALLQAAHNLGLALRAEPNGPPNARVGVRL